MRALITAVLRAGPLCAGLLLPPPAAAGVYVCLGDEGVRVYTDRQCRRPLSPQQIRAARDALAAEPELVAPPADTAADDDAADGADAVPATPGRPGW
jgi:hypothetical protein